MQRKLLLLYWCHWVPAPLGEWRLRRNPERMGAWESSHFSCPGAWSSSLRGAPIRTGQLPRLGRPSGLEALDSESRNGRHPSPSPGSSLHPSGKDLLSGLLHVHGSTPTAQLCPYSVFSCDPLWRWRMRMRKERGLVWWLVIKKSTDRWTIREQKRQHRVHRTCLFNTDIYPTAVKTQVE